MLDKTIKERSCDSEGLCSARHVTAVLYCSKGQTIVSVKSRTYCHKSYQSVCIKKIYKAMAHIQEVIHFRNICLVSRQQAENLGLNL